MISVVVPTIRGREDYYARCVDAYKASGSHEIITVRDRPTCGIAWQEGADKAKGDFIHFTADDLIPSPGWQDAALAVVKQGGLPAPRILADRIGRPPASWSSLALESCGIPADQYERVDGTPVPFPAIPFMSREMWEWIGPVIPTHYFTDNWIGYRARVFGMPVVVARSYLFVHYHAEPGRGAGMSESERMIQDEAAFRSYMERDQRGEEWWK